MDSPEITFEKLHDWSRMSDAELVGLYCDEVANILRYILRDLAPPEQRTAVITRDNFPRLVREMREAMHLGSRALGGAIIKASKLIDQENIMEARRIYEAFLGSCQSEFYCQIARHQLMSLR